MALRGAHSYARTKPAREGDRRLHVASLFLLFLKIASLDELEARQRGGGGPSIKLVRLQDHCKATAGQLCDDDAAAAALRWLNSNVKPRHAGLKAQEIRRSLIQHSKVRIESPDA